ncbi:unnamed protein product [Hymenolepis diminuta]|uniref:Uncharacterized protein n=1 Tax=Hymenolepis diminuta TaxID=6216 RepID=A0A564YBK4_HYMDI|nr:unnamed protein product [Hymenolepis diminuta]
MTYDPHLSCLNTPIDFPLSITSSFRLKIDSYKAIFAFHSVTMHACQLPAPTFPAHLLLPSLSPSLSLASIFNRCGFLEYMFGLLNSWCPASQLLSVLTQTATK